MARRTYKRLSFLYLVCEQTGHAALSFAEILQRMPAASDVYGHRTKQITQLLCAIAVEVTVSATTQSGNLLESAFGDSIVPFVEQQRR
jgi:hypothetical protein